MLQVMNGMDRLECSVMSGRDVDMILFYILIVHFTMSIKQLPSFQHGDVL